MFSSFKSTVRRLGGSLREALPKKLSKIMEDLSLFMSYCRDICLLFAHTFMLDSFAIRFSSESDKKESVSSSCFGLDSQSTVSCFSNKNGQNKVSGARTSGVQGMKSAVTTDGGLWTDVMSAFNSPKVFISRQTSLVCEAIFK